MQVQVQAANGMVYSVTVRFSDRLNGLYTTERVYRECTKGQDPMTANGASAPFAVYKGEWGDSGFTMPREWYEARNRVAMVPFIDDRWNYL